LRSSVAVIAGDEDDGGAGKKHLRSRRPGRSPSEILRPLVEGQVVVPDPTASWLWISLANFPIRFPKSPLADDAIDIIECSVRFLMLPNIRRECRR
jgi:hypothetical protein